MFSEPKAEDSTARVGLFTTTHWSVVLTAGIKESSEQADALERLCRTYWNPLYAYIRKRGYRPEDAKDLTQEFFARFLARKYVQLADPARGRFRTFLLNSLQHFLINEWERTQAAKRGGGSILISLDDNIEQQYALEPFTDLTPQKAYERQWAITLLDRVMERLREESKSAGNGERFEELSSFIWGEKSSLTYLEIGARLGMSEGAVKVAVHRLRQGYEELLRAEISQTVATPADIDDEIRDLFTAFD